MYILHEIRTGVHTKSKINQVFVLNRFNLADLKASLSS